jgi:fluoroquinolone transport system permease protein
MTDAARWRDQAAAVLRTDGRRLARDRFLIGTSLYILAIMLVMRWVIPAATAWTVDRWGFDLTPYHPLIVSHLIVQLAPFTIGLIGGFLLLENREERTVHALLVSPISLGQYLLVVGAAMVAGSTLLTVAEGLLIGVALPPWPALVITGAVGALMAPVIAMAIGALADNKTEAFAYLKIGGLAPLIATGAWFLAEPLQWVAGVYPAYWAAKAYWLAESGDAAWPIWAAGGVGVSVVWLEVARRLYRRAARR